MSTNGKEVNMISQTVEEMNGSVTTLRRFVEADQFEPTVKAALRDSNTKELRAVKVGRNEPCPCGSGDKFKKCCLWKVGCGVEIVK